MKIPNAVKPYLRTVYAVFHVSAKDPIRIYDPKARTFRRLVRHEEPAHADHQRVQ